MPSTTTLERPVIYIDMIQAESRALVSFLKHANIDFETRNFIDTLKKNPEIVQTYPNFTSPFMVAETNLGGAHAILRYLANTRLPEDNQIYPSHKVNARKR